MSGHTLAHDFARSAADFDDRIALEVGDLRLTYGQLYERSASIAATLKRDPATEGSPLTAVFGARSATIFAGVLGSLLRGHGYVPLNPAFPVHRNQQMLARSGCRTLVVDLTAGGQLTTLIGPISTTLLVVLPDHDDVSPFARDCPQHIFVGKKDIIAANDSMLSDSPPHSLAYLLFTSGSTGIPKGVMVTHENVLAFVDAATSRYELNEEDRVSQTFDLTFDLSVFDMFVAWRRGASVCCPSRKSLLNPDRYIRDARLTVWFSVPSTAMFMRRFGVLKPDRYPELRWSLFCGEPLPLALANEWAQAAPNSKLENLYGPTELTIACTTYRWTPSAEDNSERGLVPIGDPLPGMLPLVVDADLREVGPGASGELLMTGPQLTPGYWNDPEKTAAAYIRPPGYEETYYRTGDRVRRPVDRGPLVYLGRADHQIKVMGYRVELGEVESVLREMTGVDDVVAIGWPPTESGFGGVEAFIADPAVDSRTIRARLAGAVPAYMVPRRLHAMAELPLNANGKFDRNALRALLESPD